MYACLDILIVTNFFEFFYFFFLQKYAKLLTSFETDCRLLLLLFLLPLLLFVSMLLALLFSGRESGALGSGFGGAEADTCEGEEQCEIISSRHFSCFCTSVILLRYAFLLACSKNNILSRLNVDDI